MTKATIASLIEADLQLARKVKEFAVEHSDDPALADLAESLKMDPHEGLNFIQLPYDEKERLKRIHPGRMIDLLAKKNCLVKVAPPSIIRQVFTQQTLDSKLKTVDLSKQSRIADSIVKQGDIKTGLAIFERLAKKQAPASYYQEGLARFGLKPGEWTAICQQKCREKDPFFHSHVRFTPLELESLQLLSKIHQNKQYHYKATPAEAALLEEVFRPHLSE